MSACGRLDLGCRGYVEATDWGKKEFKKMVEAFTTMYMQKFLGLPDSTATPEQVRCSVGGVGGWGGVGGIMQWLGSA